ncbi:MAG TPA: tannase/feruloyl esterase family alpha/beta hydrolase [Candidatus Polarisedimenticolia bacterium]|nr:tannase/feruloyl esterase family alpha/beta hydrolase [Candidatus Polarisedimenticolia bacterium]
MKHQSFRHWLLILLAGFAIAPTPASAQQSCESLASLKIPNVTLTIARSIEPPPDFEVPSLPGRYGTPQGLKVSVPFCRVAGFAAPTTDSHISFEVWLPLAANWNGKYVGAGNPGFVGAISYGGMSREVARGYATASTDTGHSDKEASGALPPWAIGHPEKVADWGYRAVHEMTVAAKQIIQAYYGKPPKLSFWSSCHEGGNQALTEAQKYPTDYDGIAAGDPAHYITHLQAGSLYISWVGLRDGVKGAGYIPPSKYPVIHRAVLDACDALDGVRDGFIENPTRCHFDPATLQCPAKEDYPSCLTPAQVETARKIYAGAKFADGTQIYPGLEPGSELGWNWLLAGPEPMAINYGFFANIVFQDPKWDFRTFDVDRDTRLAEARVGKVVDMIDANLRPFKEHGGKLLLYQSWQEPGIPPRSAVNYYERVLATMGGASETQDFFRLFMVPGAGMCSGFSVSNFRGAWDAFDVIEKWRETGVAPDKIIASNRVGGVVDRTHPICPYPQEAIYKGTGDPYDAANFTCGIPKR